MDPISPSQAPFTFMFINDYMFLITQDSREDCIIEKRKERKKHNRVIWFMWVPKKWSHGSSKCHAHAHAHAESRILFLS